MDKKFNYSQKIFLKLIKVAFDLSNLDTQELSEVLDYFQYIYLNKEDKKTW